MPPALAFKVAFSPGAFGKGKMQEGRGLCHLLTPPNPCRAPVWAGSGVTSPCLSLQPPLPSELAVTVTGGQCTGEQHSDPKPLLTSLGLSVTTQWLIADHCRAQPRPQHPNPTAQTQPRVKEMLIGSDHRMQGIQQSMPQRSTGVTCELHSSFVSVTLDPSLCFPASGSRNRQWV